MALVAACEGRAEKDHKKMILAEVMQKKPGRDTLFFILLGIV